MSAAKPPLGQDAAWNEWLAAIASERMHHAWLLSGAKGLGKRAFARSAAAELVGATGADVDSHPDIHILDHLPSNDDEAKKKALAEQIQARAFEIATHAPLGEYANPLAARRNIGGFVTGPGNLYWNIRKN